MIQFVANLWLELYLVKIVISQKQIKTKTMSNVLQKLLIAVLTSEIKRLGFLNDK